MLRTKMFSGARSAIGVGLTFVALSFAHLPAAQAETPSQFVMSLGNSPIHTMVDEGLTDEERIRKFHVLLVDRFDLRLIGRYVLGVHWRRASPEQRIEFSGLFEDYLVSIYASRLGQYGGESLSVKSTRSEGKDTIVTTEVHGPRIFFHPRPKRLSTSTCHQEERKPEAPLDLRITRCNREIEDLTTRLAKHLGFYPGKGDPRITFLVSSLLVEFPPIYERCGYDIV